MAEEEKNELNQLKEFVSHSLMQLSKQIDDLMWFQELGDIAVVKRVKFPGLPPANTLAQSWQEKGNPIVVKGYTFVPNGADAKKKYPLMVYVHGGVHANFSTGGSNIIRELVQQGYIVISPDYRGSTGYGEQYYKLIDYGGLESEDACAAKDFMIENEPMVDKDRVGIMGWSHGGMITLFNLFNHPGEYKAGYAGVPVSDVIARMGYKAQAYRDLFSAPYHIGKTADQDPAEYRRRSPAWQAHKLQDPLLVHTNTNDEDVNCLEVEHLIKALKAEGKKFEYKIYQNEPGGHVFNRLDNKLSHESRNEIYRFLGKYLLPPNPVK